jgi:Leucine-rich repeat (LRR) protein
LPQQAQLQEGEIVNGSYRVLAKIAEGGMGAVYKVEHLAMKRLCALKTIGASDFESQNTKWQRFQQEAQTVSRLSHKSIVQVYDFGLTEGGTAYYIMDFIEGKTLLETVKAHGQLETSQALSIFIEVAYALAYAHSQSLVHRDIKPSNIMLVDNASGKKGYAVKIVDFGLAKTIKEKKADVGPGTSPETDLLTVGSPPYMSPEQFRNSEVDHRSDIYSFGCTLFEALTGVPPFVSESALVLSMKHTTETAPSLKLASMGKDFPAELETIQRRLLAKDPQDRYPDMKVVGEKLQAVLDNIDQASHPEGTGKAVAGDNAGQKSGITFAAALNDSQNITVTPLPQARAARTVLLLAPLLLIPACFAVAVTMGLQVPNPMLKSADTKPSVTSAVQPSPESTRESTKESAKESAEATANEPDRSGGATMIDNGENGLYSKQPFSSIIVDSKGTRQRVFQFPAGINLGRLVDKDHQDSIGCLARGKVVFEASQRLRFLPSITCTNSPRYFRRFRPDDLNEIDLNKNTSVTSETLNYLDHLSKLGKICLFDSALDNDCILALDQLTGLTNLDISNTEVSGAALARLKTLKKLEVIRVNQMVNVSPLISALQKSTALRNLHLDATELTKKDLEIIASIPNLEELSVSSTKIGLPGLEILSHCPKLKDLSIVSNGFHSNCVPVLKKFGSLRVLKTTCDTWSQLDIEGLKRALPLVKVNIAEKLPAPGN